MKPLLPAPLTLEDFAIWLRVSKAPDMQLYLRHAWTRARDTDRRDAELMLAWRHTRLLSSETMEMPNIWWLRDESEPRWQPVGGQL